MHTKKGFTMVEILVAMAVIAILATIVLVSYRGFEIRARDSERQIDTAGIASLLDKYYQKNGQYPSQAMMTNSNMTTVASNVPGLKKDVLTAPRITSGLNSVRPFYNAADRTNVDTYLYWATDTTAGVGQYPTPTCSDAACGGGLGTGIQCPSLDANVCYPTYILAYLKEASGSTAADADGPTNKRTVLCGKGANVNTSKSVVNWASETVSYIWPGSSLASKCSWH